MVSIAYTLASFLCKYKKEKIQTVLVAEDFEQGCCFYSRMQIRPVILVLFVILLSEKNRIMRNLCTSMYNFIMFVYLFVFLDMRLILITHTGNFDNILIIELFAIKFWVVGYLNMVVWIMVCSCEKWTFCCITNEKA